MFSRRLRALAALYAIAVVVIVARLFQLQLVEGAWYRERAERAIILQPRPLSFVRGRILDRQGEELVYDAPSWDVEVDFDVLVAEVERVGPAYRRLSRRWPEAVGPVTGNADLEAHWRMLLDDTWRVMAAHFASHGGLTVEEIRRRARKTRDRVQAIRSAVARRRGYDGPVVEETEAHALITGLSADDMVEARTVFEPYPWIHLVPSHVRCFAPDSEPMAHALGRMGYVDERAMEQDPDLDDPLGAYRPGERMGISGIERLGERTLRGRRGEMTLDRDGSLVQLIDAQHGADVTTTIHAPLQRRLYRLLEDAVRSHALSAGGAMVVVHVPTREILALVSYPAYDPARFDLDYPRLRDDTVGLPLWPRATASRYPPGSTVKPLVCLAGLFEGLISPETREECTGVLDPAHPQQWRCWAIHGTNRRMAHGFVNVEEALTGSCNVFMYRLGDRLGVDRLTSVFDMIGMGRDPGVALREADPGINPTPDWLYGQRRTTPLPAHARLFAIGQGELSMTPLQVALLMATYADGTARTATLMRGAPPSPSWTLPGTSEAWSVVRRGIYGVVNDLSGTAYKYAWLGDPNWALCGKTGSATAYPWPTAFRVDFADADGTRRSEVVPAGTRASALERFRFDHHDLPEQVLEVTVAEQWPEQPAGDDERHAHAWFGGFLQRLNGSGAPDWRDQSPIAFSVLVEFGGSGGRVSGPLGRSVAQSLIEILGEDLDPEADGASDHP